MKMGWEKWYGCGLCWGHEGTDRGDVKDGPRGGHGCPACRGFVGDADGGPAARCAFLVLDLGEQGSIDRPRGFVLLVLAGFASLLICLWLNEARVDG